MLRLRANGYSVIASELTDPENTPKNTLIRAIKHGHTDTKAAMAEYDAALQFLLGEGKKNYLKDF